MCLNCYRICCLLVCYAMLILDKKATKTDYTKIMGFCHLCDVGIGCAV